MKIATSVLAAALLSATAAWAGDPGVSDTEIKIGDVNIMTGPAAFVGRGVSLGSKIAAGEINAAGGINGRKIKILTEDDGYIPSRSFQALAKLLEEDGIFALNGTSGTANVLAMMPLITENNLPTVVTTAPSALIYKPVRPSVFTFGGAIRTPSTRSSNTFTTIQSRKIRSTVSFARTTISARRSRPATSAR